MALFRLLHVVFVTLTLQRVCVLLLRQDLWVSVLSQCTHFRGSGFGIGMSWGGVFPQDEALGVVMTVATGWCIQYGRIDLKSIYGGVA